MMTFGDVYVVVTIGAFVLTIAATIGWFVDHRSNLRSAWVEYRRRQADFRRVQERRAHADYAEWSGMPVPPPPLPRRDPSPSPRGRLLDADRTEAN